MTPTERAQKLFADWNAARERNLAAAGEVSDGVMFMQLAAFEAVEEAIRAAVRDALGFE